MSSAAVSRCALVQNVSSLRRLISNSRFLPASSKDSNIRPPDLVTLRIDGLYVPEPRTVEPTRTYAGIYIVTRRGEKNSAAGISAGSCFCR